MTGMSEMILNFLPKRHNIHNRESQVRVLSHAAVEPFINFALKSANDC